MTSTAPVLKASCRALGKGAGFLALTLVFFWLFS